MSLKTNPPRGHTGPADGTSRRFRPARWASRTARRLDPPLIAIVCFAGFVRLWDLSRVGLRGDEAVYAGQAAVVAGAKGFGRFFILTGRGNSNFLLFQEIVAIVYKVTGVGDVAARVVAASLSTLTVLVTFWIAATLFGRRTGLFSALLLAVSAYSVSLGRLALLDSTLTFFFAAAMLCAVKWISTKRSIWLYGFAAAASLTFQAKVPGGLVLLVLAGYLLITRSLEQLTVRRVLVAAGVFVVALTPAIVQLALNGSLFVEFLSSSVRRSSDVPWYYYGRLLVSYEGPLMLALWIVGVAFAIGRRSRADALLLLWLVSVIGFYELYPLKAFNYLLPALPALSILSGRAVSALLQWLDLNHPWRYPKARQVMSAGVLSVAVVAAAAPYLRNVWRDDPYVGLKEAATWMAASAPPDAGVMTISNGSAQYVFAFYSHRDAYPFGRFNLATVMPGGQIIQASAPGPGSRTPRDWVNRWPARLIASGRVSYLVYYTTIADDPPQESQVAQSSTQRQFRLLIERYGGQLVHTVYHHHEGRAWIYRLTVRSPRPHLAYTVHGSTVALRGTGFTENTTLTATYNGRQVARGRSDATGSASLSLALPVRARPRYLIVVTDEDGRFASMLVPKPVISYSTQNGIATVTGVSFQPNSPITVSYHGALAARGRSAGDGSVSVSFPAPGRVFPRWQLVATDSAGNYGSLKLLRPALTATVSSGRMIIHGSGYPSGRLMTVTYHGRFMTSVQTDDQGSFTVSFALPQGAQPQWLVFVRDTSDRYTVVLRPGIAA